MNKIDITPESTVLAETPGVGPTKTTVVAAEMRSTTSLARTPSTPKSQTTPKQTNQTVNTMMTTNLCQTTKERRKSPTTRFITQSP